MKELTIEKPMLGGARELLDAEELARRPASSVGGGNTAAGRIVFEPQRSRPRYFDGRFLAATDLTREQTYFLERQALLGRALGSGVVAGLEVRRGTAADAAALGRTASSADLLVISAGQGITPGGELVGLDDELPVALAEVAESERLNAAFGLRRRPRPPARGRTGLFVLGLRAVEFTGNRISSYPTSVTGKRSSEDGDWIEGTAVTLVPYPEDGFAEPGERRARVAHELFVQGVVPGLPTGVLPIAMVALDRGTVLWHDEWLVRREVGRDDLLGLTAEPRALREAHLLHYRDHLDDVLAERARRGARFAAGEHFDALPPAGPLPAAAIGSENDVMTQLYFPPEVDAEISIVPQDEVPALLEDSLLMPPIDLTARGDDLEGTAVLVLVPVARSRFDTLAASLQRIRLPLKPAIPGFFARRRPLARLRGLELRRLTVAAPAETDPVTALWRQLLADAAGIVYVRRRHVRRWDAAVSAVVTPAGGVLDVASDGEVLIDMDRVELLKAHRLHSRFGRITAGTGTGTQDAVLTLVGTHDVADNRILLDGALHELEETVRSAGTVTTQDVLDVTERYSEPEVTGGVRRAEALRPQLFDNPTVVNNLVKTGANLDFARLASRAPSDGQVVALAQEVEAVGGRTGETARAELRELITRRLEEMGP